jgi:hypothetical protein
MRFAACLLIGVSAALAQPHMPDLAAQKAAMKKLDFLAGTWTGDGLAHTGPGDPIKVRQTEEVQYKLDGLVMLVEGTGRDPVSGKVIFNALATISYDDAAKVYRFRSHNDGRFLDTELKLQDKGFEWGFTAGPAVIKFVMKINDKGEWHEIGTATIGSNPPRRTVELLVRK